MAKFKITDTCINCGSCAGVCPVEAIECKGTMHAISEKCIACGSCVNTCPVEAIVENNQ